MRILAATLFTILACTAFQSKAQYAANLIPKEMLSRASATVRFKETVLEIKSFNQAIETEKSAITIHNKAGDEYADLYIFYDKIRQIKDLKGEIQDEDGKVIRKFGMKDFKDYSASGQSNLYADDRVKSYSPLIRTYPYTIVYEYEIRHQQTLNLPSWQPNYSIDLSVEKSSFQVITSPEIDLRINERNLTNPVITKKEAKFNSYTWTVENIRAERSEPYSPSRRTTGMFVEVIPKSFQFYKYKGEVTDWKTFGLWMNETLLKDKQTLPASTVAQVKELTANLSSNREKAKALYEYMQKKTRYISIQIGVGGNEPFPAEQVDRLGYGDCKALANYMKALLDVVDIPSYYSVVTAGTTKSDLYKDFASLQGNHIILCLPSEKDTTWLECTSSESPFGYLGDFTDDRLVLAITPTGGEIMRTQSFNFEQNLQHRKSTLKLDETGLLKGTLETKFMGTQFDNHFTNYKKSLDDQKKELRGQYDIDRIEFTDVKYSLDDKNLVFTENLTIEVPNYAIKNGNNLTIYPNVFNKASAITELAKRINPVKITRGYTDIDEIEIELPEDLDARIKPADVKNEVPMGSYEMSIKMKDGKMYCYRKIQIREGEYPAESYAAFTQFMKDATFSDSYRYILPFLDKK
ncbi:DUF3857 domain-containing protein [Sphingobacterium sp. DK4209]|uniref:DUF3857 domain-containing protein n=1 Tax=Sphingobacterium zhuxiongii TaxID=2662364 RepID=A0A5Q0Q6Q8_9SPHI|nr:MULTISPECIES: DUF3857 domain-containing protein [unclassified Sphingobacterium]MVZ64413.1 DUF3857 domain-containing protein [Sphingobacterium sp. DK4209]QGA25755.1 DUF3857 domain-containing protein [Sphingobacterium sp. dk4302]